MKSTQAWGWLAAGVLAAGLNAAYHDGDLQWAHRVADRAQHVSGAVVALASGRADRFLAEARELSDRNDGEVAAFSDTVVAKADQEMTRAEAAYARAEARQQAHCARMQTEHARIETHIAARHAFVHMPDVQVETAFRTIQIPDGRAIRVPQIELSQVKFEHCSRIRMRLPAMPNIAVPSAPPVNVSLSSESDEQ
jgi:hypothetical protein